MGAMTYERFRSNPVVHIPVENVSNSDTATAINKFVSYNSLINSRLSVYNDHSGNCKQFRLEIADPIYFVTKSLKYKNS